MAQERPRRVLVGATGSVASVKLPELVQQLLAVQTQQLEVQVVTTAKARHFFDPAHVTVTCYVDADEWEWLKIGDPILHIELRKWADVLVVAPLGANTMGKMANGLCDNLLTCIVRAWDPSKPLLYAPAMNTAMWTHPMTTAHTSLLSQLGYVQIPPVSKTLACGDQGIGAMASVPDIVQTVLQNINHNIQ